jgi:peptidyl-prolyl cis-trans isomerase SurA
VRGEILERVIALVNGEIITLSEFQARQLAAAQAARVGPEGISPFLRQNNARILQEAIDEILLLQRAAEAGLRLRPEYIDEVIESIKKENNITSDEQMQEALRREGLTLADLKRNIERSMTRRMLLQRDVESRISVSDAEMREAYEAGEAEFTKPATVTLQEILVREDAGGAAFARELVRRARAGEDFAELARTYSTAPTRSSGGDLGQIEQGELNPALEKVAFALPLGSISDPVVVGDGWRILKVVAKSSGSVLPFESARDTIRQRLMMGRYDTEYDAYMKELRETAQVQLKVREVPLQLTGTIPEGSLLDALDPFGGPGAPPAAAAAAPEAEPPADAPAADEEISTTPQARPERVAPGAERPEPKSEPPPP